jgi:hypothetical protein
MTDRAGLCLGFVKWLGLISSSGLLFSSALAQNVLLTEYEGKTLPVVAVRDQVSYVEVKGQRVPARSQRFRLASAPEFLPVFVAARR